MLFLRLMAAALGISLAIASSQPTSAHPSHGPHTREVGMDSAAGGITSRYLERGVFIQSEAQSDHRNPVVVAQDAPGGAASDQLTRGMELYAAKKWAHAFKILRPLAEAGQPQAQALVGQMYVEGKGTAKDAARGLALLKEAAGKKNEEAGANYAMGRFYLVEEGLTGRGLELLEAAASAGYLPAMELLGEAFLGRHGVAPSRLAAATWYRKAIDSGSESAFAKYYVGMAYVEGILAAPDAAAGAILLHKSMEAGDLYAQTELGKLHAEGRMVSRDTARAEQLLSDAVAQGHVPAMMPLGDVYLSSGWPGKAVRCYGASLLAAHEAGNQQMVKQAVAKLIPFSVAGHLGVTVEKEQGACQFEPGDLMLTLMREYFSGR